MDHAAVQRIARQQTVQIIQPPKAFIDGVQIKQCLRRMLIVAIPGIDDRNAGSRIRCDLR